jgi:hypothetical protein
VTQAMECVLTRSPRTAPGLLAQPFYFQGAPMETFGWEYTAEWSEYATLGRKRYSRPVAPQLVTYEFDTMFADYLYTDVPTALQTYVTRVHAGPMAPIDAISTHPFFAPPMARMNELRRLARSLTPMVLTMADPKIVKAVAATKQPVNAANLGISSEVTLRSVRQEERMGEPDALYAHVTFVEYVAVSLARSKLPVNLTIKTLPSNKCSVARLAKFYYGDAANVKPIYNRNKPWLAHFTRNENLRAIALGEAGHSKRMKSLKALLAKHPQVIVPALKPSSR